MLNTKKKKAFLRTKVIQGALVAALALAGNSAKAGVMVGIEDGYYGDSSLTLSSAQETGNPALVGAAADFGITFNIFLVNGSNQIVDDIFAPGGPFVPGSSDDIFVAGGAMNDGNLGTTCVASANEACVSYDFLGDTIDLTSELASVTGGNFCGLPPCDLSASSTDTFAPEPNSIILMSAALVVSFLARKRFARTNS